MKICATCKRHLSVESFHLKRGKPRSQCKDCVRAYNLHRAKTVPAPLEKECYKCRRQLLANEFSVDKLSPDGLNSRCKDCGRNQELKRLYGLTADQYKTLLVNQEFKCAVCQVSPGQRKLHVDHCHKTGKVRGLLCALCNRAAGYIRDDPAIARGLADYLETNLASPKM